MIKFEKISKAQWLQDCIIHNITNVTLEPSEYDNNTILPRRGTACSAGYDFYAPYRVEIQPNETVVVLTGVKCALNDTDVLMLYPRSSMGFKYGIQLVNTVGIIDADYYNNPSNEGHIMIGIKNTGTKSVVIEKGDRFAQGIISEFKITDDDEPVSEVRKGGIGSTDK